MDKKNTSLTVVLLVVFAGCLLIALRAKKEPLKEIESNSHNPAKNSSNDFQVEDLTSFQMDSSSEPETEESQFDGIQPGFVKVKKGVNKDNSLEYDPDTISLRDFDTIFRILAYPFPDFAASRMKLLARDIPKITRPLLDEIEIDAVEGLNGVSAPSPVGWISAPETFIASFKNKLAQGEVNMGPVKSVGTLQAVEPPFPIAPPWTDERLRSLLVPEAYYRLTHGPGNSDIIPLRKVMNEHYEIEDKFIRDKQFIHVVALSAGKKGGSLERSTVVTLDTRNLEVLHWIAPKAFSQPSAMEVPGSPSEENH